MTGITVDGQNYNVRLNYETLERSFSLVEGNNSGTALTGKTIRDILGTAYSYTLGIEPNPANAEEYDRLYDVLSAPQETHVVSLPYGQTTIEFACMITGGKDTYLGKLGGKERWSRLTINFIAIQPQRGMP